MQRKPPVIFYNKLKYTIMTIYISLPITGQEQEAREKADLTKAMLSRAGHKVISPFDIYAGAKPKWEDHICCDLRALMDCDAVYLCEGWQFSRGCRIEAKVAQELNLQILYERQADQSGTYYYFNR